jgi:hypothetical protein
MRNVSGKSCRETQKHAFYVELFSEIVLFERLCGKSGTARQVTEGGKAHAL